MILKFISGERPLIRVLINGKSAVMLVDTGASINMIDEAKQSKFKFNFGHNAGSVVGLNGEESPTYVLKNCEVLIAGTFKYYQWLSGDMGSTKESIKKQTGYEIDGIIGTPCIKDLEMKINLNDLEITLGY